MKSNKVLWLSRHVPTKRQISSLHYYYGRDVEIVQDSDTFSSVDDIVKRYRADNYQDMVIVAPMFMISKIIEFGIHPLYAKMKQVKNINLSETSNNGRHYVFVEFKRIKKLCFEFEDDLLAN